MKLTLMVDLILAAGFLLIVYAGLRRGFVRTAMSLMAMAAAIALAVALTSVVTPLMVNRWAAQSTQSFIEKQAEKRFPEADTRESLLNMYSTAMTALRKVLGVGGATTSELSKAVETGCTNANITDESTVTAIKKVVSDAVKQIQAQTEADPNAQIDTYSVVAKALRDAGVTNNTAVDSIAGQVNKLSQQSTLANLFTMVAGEDETNANGEVDALAGLSKMLARIWVGILVFALFFALFYAIFRTFIDRMEFIDRIPIVGTLNTVLGGILGVIAGLFVLMLPIFIVVKASRYLLGESAQVSASFFSGSRILGLLARIYPGA